MSWYKLYLSAESKAIEFCPTHFRLSASSRRSVPKRDVGALFILPEHSPALCFPQDLPALCAKPTAAQANHKPA